MKKLESCQGIHVEQLGDTAFTQVTPVYQVCVGDRLLTHRFA